MALFVRRLLVRAGLRAKKTTAVGRSVFPLTFPPDVAEHVRECYQQAQGIVEYGSGGSTKLAAELGVSCLSVESDPDWAAALTRHLDSMSDEPASAQVMHIDIGTTEAWGYPTDPSHWDQYWRYPLQVWEQDPAPSHVLIDGRMRKACFAATLLNIRRETTILFDDYTDRPFYHGVEDILAPTLTIGRMAEFHARPGMLDQAGFAALIPWFFDLR